MAHDLTPCCCHSYLSSSLSLYRPTLAPCHQEKGIIIKALRPQEPIEELPVRRLSRESTTHWSEWPTTSKLSNESNSTTTKVDDYGN